MLLFILSVLGHPAVLLFHALHWSVGGHFEASVLEILKDVLPESGRAQMEVLFAEAPEWTAWSSLNGTLNADSRRLGQQEEGTDVPFLNPKSDYFRWTLAAVSIVVLTYAHAFCYKRRIADRRAPFKGWEENPLLSLAIVWHGGIWKYNCCEACCECNAYSLYSCFCLGARLGDTYTAANVGPGYYTYVTAVAAVWLSGPLVGVLWKVIMPMIVPAWDGWSDDSLCDGLMTMSSLGSHVLLAAWLAGRTEKLREALGDPMPKIGNRWTKDFCCWWWFPCCSAVQQGRQMDQMTHTETGCCFQLRDFELEDVCGENPRLAGCGPPPMRPVGHVVGQPLAASKTSATDPSLRKKPLSIRAIEGCCRVLRCGKGGRAAQEADMAAQKAAEEAADADNAE